MFDFDGVASVAQVVGILTANGEPVKEYYYIGEHVLKCILIFDIMFASLFNVSLQTVVYLFARMVAVLKSYIIERRVFNGLPNGISVSDTIAAFTSQKNVLIINIIVIAFVDGDRIINTVLSCFKWFFILATLTIGIILCLANVSTTQTKAQGIGIIVFHALFTRIDAITLLTPIAATIMTTIGSDNI